MLHNAMLSIGLRFSEDPRLNSDATLRIYCDEAKKHLRVEGMNPTVATVQALVHLASHHNLMAEHNLGWLHVGMAVRCGLTCSSCSYLPAGNGIEAKLGAGSSGTQRGPCFACIQWKVDRGTGPRRETACTRRPKDILR
jgi:hypothetical protein